MNAKFEVPPDGDAYHCPHCETVEATERLLALHKGQAHPERLNEREQAAYEAAYQSEQERIRLGRLAALGALVLLYFGLLLTYAFVT